MIRACSCLFAHTTKQTKRTIYGRRPRAAALWSIYLCRVTLAARSASHRVLVPPSVLTPWYSSRRRAGAGFPRVRVGPCGDGHAGGGGGGGGGGGEYGFVKGLRRKEIRFALIIPRLE